MMKEEWARRLCFFSTGVSPMVWKDMGGTRLD